MKVDVVILDGIVVEVAPLGCAATKDPEASVYSWFIGDLGVDIYDTVRDAFDEDDTAFPFKAMEELAIAFRETMNKESLPTEVAKHYKRALLYLIMYCPDALDDILDNLRRDE